MAPVTYRLQPAISLNLRARATGTIGRATLDLQEQACPGGVEVRREATMDRQTVAT